MDKISEITFSIAMDSSSSKNSEETRPCTKCKASIISVTDSRKWCANCREKARLRSAQRAQQKRVLLETQDGQDDGNVLRELKRKMEGHADATQQEKKRLKTSHVSGDIKRKVDGEVKNKKVLLSLFSALNAYTMVQTKPGNRYEYQTASEMYNKLHTFSKTKKYLFSGHYSIIADPEIDHNQRVKLVAKDLRKIAKIPFDCLGQGTKSVATLYSRDSNAIASSPLGSPVDRQADSVPRCKGIIKVMSQDDSSHPLGIAGQKITVTIEH
ncbi:hypothetical protein C0995_015248 [Termitomyces sp. Mi166|nr:hypothetical protein C0995_015248 [Termitomyces sp. Mi166\